MSTACRRTVRCCFSSNGSGRSRLPQPRCRAHSQARGSPSQTSGNTFSEAGEHNDDWWSARSGFRLDWRAGTQDSVTFSGDYFHSDAGRKDLRAKTTTPYSFVNSERELTNGADVLGRWTHTIDKDSSWTLQAYWDNARRDSTNDIVHFGWNIYDVDFQHNFKLGDRQQIVWGMGYRLTDSVQEASTLDNGFNIDWAQHSRLLNLLGAFLQDEISIVPEHISLTLGSKIEHNDFTGWEVQPTARALWTPTKEQSVWASFSRAVRTPSAADDGVKLNRPPPVPGSPVFQIGRAHV